MMNLRSDEQMLIGRWITVDGSVKADPVCQRIDWLLAHKLRKVAISPQWGGWETLYQDTDDGRYWERTFPESSQHGAGPPKLQVLTPDEAKRKYGLT